MSKILLSKEPNRYNESNTTSIIDRGCYNTGFTVQDIDLISPTSHWLDRELMEKICDLTGSPVFSDVENDFVMELLDKKLRSPIPNLDLNNNIHRLVAAHAIIHKLPKGSKDGTHTLLLGLPGLGKTTYGSQESGNIYRSLRHNRKKNGDPKTQVHYYQSEPGAIDSTRFMYLTGMDSWDMEHGLRVHGGSDQSTVDFINLVITIHDEKIKNYKDYVIETMAVSGTIKYTMAPTLLILDSFSVLGVEKYEQKMNSSFASGKEGSKESDPMRALQVKSTMLNNVGLLKYCDAANIQIYFLAHVGNDQGDMIGHQQLQMYKGANSKLGFKAKGVPNGMGFLMNRTYSMYNTVKADILNDMYKMDEFIFLVNVLVEKARGSKVYKDKTLPLAFMGEGKFDNAWSMFYFWHKQLNKFDFVKGSIPGIDEKISASRLQRLINDPKFNIIIEMNVFNEIGIDKMYAISDATSKVDVNTALNNMSDLNSLIASLGASEGDNDLELNIAEDLGLGKVVVGEQTTRLEEDVA